MFQEKKNFDLNRISNYSELELVLQDDGRFSLWGNLPQDSHLLQDTRKDPRGLVKEAALLADEIRIEDDADVIDPQEEDL